MSKHEMPPVSPKPESPDHSEGAEEISGGAGESLEISVEKMREMLGGDKNIKQMQQKGLANQAEARARALAEQAEVKLSGGSAGDEISNLNIPEGSLSNKEEKPKKNPFWKFW